MATSKKSAFPALNRMTQYEGILLVDKDVGSTSFHIVSLLRKLTKIEKIGHAGTLDPFATGVMVMLIGRPYTSKSDQFLGADKEYRATITLGTTTDTYDIEGQIISRSDLIPTRAQVEEAIAAFQGEILQVPPMFSAKKVKGQKLCDLARKGIVIERKQVLVKVATTLLEYNYPNIEILVSCSKGTYIRSLAFDLGELLGTGAHLSTLSRIRSGHFLLSDCIPQANLKIPGYDLTPFLRKTL